MSPPSVRAARLRINPERRGASPNSGFRGFWEFQGQEWGHWFGDAVEVSCTSLSPTEERALLGLEGPVAMPFLQEAPGLPQPP